MPRTTTATAAATAASIPTTEETNDQPQHTNRIVPLNGESKAGEVKSSVRIVIEQIDTIKETLKIVVRQFGDVVDALRQVEKQKKANDKEVEGVREKLRAIQSVNI